MAVCFGDFAFDQERRQLLRSGEPVPLETKAYELLALLLSRRPNALSKAQIRDVLWPGTFVSESALARLVTQLRAACGDDAQTPRFIRTVHGFGYAFCGDVHEGGDGPAVRWRNRRRRVPIRAFHRSRRRTPTGSSDVRRRWRPCGERSTAVRSWRSSDLREWGRRRCSERG